MVIFYLYEKILKDSEKEKNEKIYELQLAMYQKQLEIMQGQTIPTGSCGTT